MSELTQTPSAPLLFTLPPLVQSRTFYSTTEPNTCTLIGDADIYGPGVRVSFYISFVAGVLAMEWHLPEELEKVRRAVVVISLAVTINTIVSTVQGSFAVLEWYIVFLMTVVLSLPIFVFPWRHNDTSIVKGVYALTIAIVFAVQPWIYFILPDQGARQGFFSVIGCILALFLILRFAWATIVDSGILKKLLDRKDHAALVEHLGRETQNTRAKQVIDLVKLAAFALVGIGSIVFVEEVIRINRIDLSEAPLDRSSQLIPLLVALFNLLPILWGLVKARLVEKEDPEIGL
ncbi:hypothetical protein M409DRAFT_21313 [Zasmidium cellare ATCC 36951]|uniref:Uncharacterized protein n=1 Tax=Zasmidium cellare ATCC 36951 TaxID=1080233 RepID=A0A6A6CPG4_ZASCE|nr:uncharacterized protein M409DRAFT_21313 [Zasmidium cellare ATCC 36951]KAF2168563.1 hypothetical protein M409DRAFT_21313 [Zasmidium cellare ATCC 36951]